MRIAVLTTLLPLSTRPREGVFAQRRWQHMRRRGHELSIVHPLPWTPPLIGRWLGPRAWRELAPIGAREALGGLDVAHPRYLHLPGRELDNARRAARCAVAQALRGARPEVAIADYAWPMALAADELARAGVPLVVHGRGSDVLQVAGEAGLAEPLAAALRRAGHWCAVSRDLVARMDELGDAPGRGRLVANGVDTVTFHVQQRSTCRARLGLAADGALVLVVGHLIERKDPLLALAAFALFARDREQARLVFVGRGPLQARVLDEARRLGLGERVSCVGEVEPSALADWYGASDVLLLTSRREGRPNVVLEAFACGRPVLATDAGGTRELLEGLPGSLVGARDAELLAAGLARLCAQAPDALALRTRTAAFDWDASCAVLEGVLRAAVGGAP